MVSTGHIALFDVYWDTEEKELANNPCPPTVEHVPAEGKTQASDTRTASNINIEETVIHIPNSAKVDLSTSATYTEINYEEVWKADAKENRDTDDDGAGDGVGDGIVWVLPACPDGALTESLCIAFSADLLNPEDWGIYKDNAAVPGPVQFQVDHAHQHDVGEQGGRYVLAYHDAAGQAGPYNAIWDTSDLDLNLMDVLPGEYENPIWFFTRAGRYEFQVHVEGHPEHTQPDGVDPISTDDTVTSDVREYFFHVGLMAGLSVGVTAEAADSTDTALDPGDDVTITVTASNAGPDTATSTHVDVSLPPGLVPPDGAQDFTYSPSQGTYDSGTGVWTLGDLTVTDDENDPTDDDSPTLTITAEVADGMRGVEQVVTADIYATEHIGSRDVLELDPQTDDNTAEASVTPADHANPNPIFKIARSLPEGRRSRHLGGRPGYGPGFQ